MMLSSKVQMKRMSSFGSKPTVAAHDSQRLSPGIAAGEVDHDVDPALVLAVSARPSEQALTLGDPVGRSVVDANIGAEAFEALELLFARCADDDRRTRLLSELYAASSDAA